MERFDSYFLTALPELPQRAAWPTEIYMVHLATATSAQKLSSRDADAIWRMESSKVLRLDDIKRKREQGSIQTPVPAWHLN